MYCCSFIFISLCSFLEGRGVVLCVLSQTTPHMQVTVVQALEDVHWDGADSWEGINIRVGLSLGNSTKTVAWWW